jgi:hypothetical protein
MNKEDKLLPFPPTDFVQLIKGTTVVTVKEFNEVVEKEDIKKPIVTKVIKKTIIKK